MSVIQDSSHGQQTNPIVERVSSAYSAPGPRPPVRPRRSHRGAVILSLLAVVVILGGLAVAVVPPSSPGHQILTNFTGNAPASTIHQVIQTADAEQAQALASNNPSLMSNTATAAYYRQLVQIKPANGCTGCDGDPADQPDLGSAERQRHYRDCNRV